MINLDADITDANRKYENYRLGKHILASHEDTKGEHTKVLCFIIYSYKMFIFEEPFKNA